MPPRFSGAHDLQRSGVGNWLYLADWYEKKQRLISSHLACFHGGNFIYVGVSGPARFPSETDSPWNKGWKVTEQPNHRRIRFRTERGMLEHLRKFTVSFTVYAHMRAFSPALGLELALRYSLGKLPMETSPTPLPLNKWRHTIR